MRRTSANSSAQAASTDAVGSPMRSKPPLRVRDVEQPIGAPSRARNHDSNSGQSVQLLRVPGIPMSSCTHEPLWTRAQAFLAEQKGSFRLILDISKHA